jgi:hypothetical protein
MLRQYAVQLRAAPAFSTHTSAATAEGRLLTTHVMCFLPEPLHQHGNLRTVLNEAKSFSPTTNFVCFPRYLWTLEAQKLTFGRNLTQWQFEKCVNEKNRHHSDAFHCGLPDETNWYITKGKVITAHSAIELSSALWEYKINTLVTKCWLYIPRSAGRIYGAEVNWVGTKHGQHFAVNPSAKWNIKGRAITFQVM